MTEIGDPLGMGRSDIEALAAFSRLGAALLCGGVIGLDRELHRRPAGLRTHMLVALASALFTILTFEIVASVVTRGSAISVDPIRVVEALTAGVAFLAAGTILVNKGDVKGLTTGASLWLAGAAGLATGMGLYWLAYAVTVSALVVLVIIEGAKLAVAHWTRRWRKRSDD